MPRNSLHTVKIDDLSDPRVAEYCNLKDGALAQARGVFIAEGPLVVRELFRSRFRTRSALIEEGKVAGLADALSELPESVPIYTASQGVLDAVAGIHLHRGILAAGDRSPSAGVHELIERSKVLVVLEDLSNHDNVGGIFRVCAALGGSRCGVMLSPRCCDPLYRKALRVSIGHSLHVPFAQCELDDALWGRLQREGFTIVATHGGNTCSPLDSVGKLPKLALVLGAEGPGLRESTLGSILAHGGQNTRVPMTRGVDSLNIVVASGILLSRLVDPGS